MLHETGDRWMGVPGTFHYAACARCSQVYLRARPPRDELGRYYPAGYIRRGRGPRSIRRAFRRHDLASRVRLASDQPGAWVLDVGCARGDFLSEMRRAGWVPAGVEPTSWLADQALARGLPVWGVPLAAAELPPRRFDVVTMWDVLEHVWSPLDDLRAVSRLLRPGGRLVVNTPSLDGWDARLFGTAWAGWDAPRHLTVFSRASLAALLERAGFRVCSWHRVFETYLTTALTIGLAVRERWPLAGRLVWPLLHARPVRLAAEPAFAGLDAAWGGGSVAVVAETAAAEGGRHP